MNYRQVGLDLLMAKGVVKGCDRPCSACIRMAFGPDSDTSVLVEAVERSRLVSIFDGEAVDVAASLALSEASR